MIMTTPEILPQINALLETTDSCPLGSKKEITKHLDRLKMVMFRVEYERLRLGHIHQTRILGFWVTDNADDVFGYDPAESVFHSDLDHLKLSDLTQIVHADDRHLLTNSGSFRVRLRRGSEACEHDDHWSWANVVVETEVVDDVIITRGTVRFCNREILTHATERVRVMSRWNAVLLGLFVTAMASCVIVMYYPPGGNPLIRAHADEVVDVKVKLATTGAALRSAEEEIQQLREEAGIADITRRLKATRRTITSALDNDGQVANLKWVRAACFSLKDEFIPGTSLIIGDTNLREGGLKLTPAERNSLGLGDTNLTPTP